MTFNSNAWMQRHRNSFAGPYAEPGDRYPCPDHCGRVLSAQWLKDIFGLSPDQLKASLPRESAKRHLLSEPADWADPSDDRLYNQEQRSSR